MVNTVETVGLRPHARLLTMLGEQLIRSESIALAELIKNSYDADATSVTVDFVGFDADLRAMPGARIRIQDDGDGMSRETLLRDWMNPASPSKLLRKRSRPRTEKGRHIQGEKGLGRFAIFRLGSCARVTTAIAGSDDECTLTYDLGFLDQWPASTLGSLERTSQADEAPTDPGRDEDVYPEDSDGGSLIPRFLDEVQVELATSDKRALLVKSGTIIEVSGLRSEWGLPAIRDAMHTVDRLQDPEDPNSLGFRVTWKIDGSLLTGAEADEATLETIIEHRAVISCFGTFDPESVRLSLVLNGREVVLSLGSADVVALKAYKDYFGNAELSRRPENTECGPFSFSLHVFDLSPRADARYKLDEHERRLVKASRIYLFRDGVRVLPYGDPDDDWLSLDAIRGNVGASRILSNDQTVGFVRISHKLNPKLQDKTNREGLLESGHAFSDFKALLQIAIQYLRTKPYARYLDDQRRRSELRRAIGRASTDRLDAILASPTLAESDLSQLKQFRRSYNQQIEYLTTRAERTEDLAGVGLSVEAASHDILSAAILALRMSRSVAERLSGMTDIGAEARSELQSAIDSMSFVVTRLEDVQGLFVSTSRGKGGSESVLDAVQTAARIYDPMLRRSSIAVVIEGSELDFSTRAPDAALLQVFVNLFDNATFWLRAGRTADPEIHITIGADETITFVDNGPGISRGDAPYIFEPFYSGKGDSGKGLGLYIARQVGIRNGFTVDLAELYNSDGVTPAKFVVDFGEIG